MKKIFFLLILLIVISCGRNTYEKKIIGNWYDDNELMKFDFSKDSVTVFDYNIQKTTWTANNKKINIQYTKFINNSDSIIKLDLNYSLKNNDTLIIKKSGNSFTFLKAKNYLDFLSKKYIVKFDLEENPKAYRQIKDDNYGIRIFLGYYKNKIIVKSEFSENLNNLDNDLNIKLSQINKDYQDNYRDVYEYEKWNEIVLHYYLFVDKKIPKDTLNFYIAKLRKSKIKKLYRVYQTEEPDFMSFQTLNQIKL